MTNTRLGKISAWAGIVAPVIFVLVFMVEGFLRPGYDPLSMYISALSLGPRGWIQIVNFLVLGFLLFVFTLGLSREIPSGKASRGGIICLYTLSALFFISGPFVMDPADTPSTQLSVHGFIHGLSGGIVFLLMPVTIFVFLRRIWTDVDWKSIKYWSLILFIIEALGVIVFTYVSKIPTETNMSVNWLGLFQRIALIPYMLWQLVFSIAFLRNK